MTNDVDHPDPQHGWPPNQFHAVFDSFTEWLDDEAPPDMALTRVKKSRNARRFVTKVRGPAVNE